MNEGRDEPTYTVGRGKPPTHSRFKPGQSGNSRGRPKGSKNHQTIILEVANEKLEATVNGRRRKVSVYEAAFKQVARKAVAGEHRSAELFFKRVDQITGTQRGVTMPAEDAELSLGSDDDAQVLEAFMQRIKKEGSS